MTSPPVGGGDSIGFIGLGAMGAPMARRLASLGRDVIVFDVNVRAVESVVAAGGRAAQSARAVAAEAKLVMTCLPSLEVLREVALGTGGLCEGKAIRTLVDFSTTGAHFAQELSSALRQRNIMMLDAPITGNVVTAGNGGLGIMCSGPLPAFEQAEGVMRELASAEVLYLGDRNGKAQTLKLLNNLLSATGMAASCEAFILGVKGGLDPKVLLQIVNAGEASSSATRNKFPKSVLPRRFDFGARMAITAKDTSLTVKESEELGVPMWIGQQVRQVWKFAVSQGGADRDGTSLITYLEPLAGVEVRLRSEGEPAPQDTAPARPFNEHVLVCATRHVPLFARRLRGFGWRVAIAGEPYSPQQAGARLCTLVGVAAQADCAAVIEAMPRAETRRVVVNTCLVAAQRARALAQGRSDDDVYLDAPISGTAQEIEAGTATVIASGPSGALRAVTPLLDALGEHVFRVSGEPGDAQLAHQINGALSATLFAVSCEAFVAGAKAGLDPVTMTRILGIETGRNAASARIIPQQVATRQFNHGRLLGEALAELEAVSDAARELGVTTWILDKCRLLYGLSCQLGSPDDDITRLITHYERWADVQVKADDAPVEGSRK
jgi:3-hydroxyisobutyrate dehydrogenase-like beta-hydroxyacid dehydrogenase